MAVAIARVYEALGTEPTSKFLVDRLWPRGVAKATAPFESWLKEIAPSPELRKWYSHEVGKYDEFAVRYRDELEHPPPSELLDMLALRAASEAVVLLTATRDIEHSGAAVLREALSVR